MLDFVSCQIRRIFINTVKWCVQQICQLCNLASVVHQDFFLGICLYQWYMCLFVCICRGGKWDPITIGHLRHMEWTDGLRAVHLWLNHSGWMLIPGLNSLRVESWHTHTHTHTHTCPSVPNVKLMLLFWIWLVWKVFLLASLASKYCTC